ncbi:hypothetical protein Ciccas_009894 [Cichlidogyrus casuarinus]|uniref:PDZ domain-containing protein n=1 Tax=Cichlidogyrus casuarinus TaxID=1844966 RepID=A0ABD2PWQ1_9PLAT
MTLQQGQQMRLGLQWLEVWLKTHRLEGQKKPLKTLLEFSSVLATPTEQLIKLTWYKIRLNYPELSSCLLRHLLEHYKSPHYDSLDNPNWAIDRVDAFSAQKDPMDHMVKRHQTLNACEKLDLKQSAVEDSSSLANRSNVAPTFTPPTPKSILENDTDVKVHLGALDSKYQSKLSFLSTAHLFEYYPLLGKKLTCATVHSSANSEVSSSDSMRADPNPITPKKSNSGPMTRKNRLAINTNPHSRSVNSPPMLTLQEPTFDEGLRNQGSNSSLGQRSGLTLTNPVHLRNSTKNSLTQDNEAHYERRFHSKRSQGLRSPVTSSIDRGSFRALGMFVDNSDEDSDYSRVTSVSSRSRTNNSVERNRTTEMVSCIKPKMSATMPSISNSRGRSNSEVTPEFEGSVQDMSSLPPIKCTSPTISRWQMRKYTTKLTQSTMAINLASSATFRARSGNLISNSIDCLDNRSLCSDFDDVYFADTRNYMGALSASQSSLNMHQLRGEELLQQFQLDEGLAGSNIKNVTLIRAVNKGFGLKLVDGEQTWFDQPGVYVKAIAQQSAADLSGEIKPGYRVLAINGKDLTNYTYTE